MKLAGITLASLFALTTYAADTFVCEVTKKVVVSETCTVCENYSYNGDGDCTQEVVTTCLNEKTVETGVQDIKLHPGSAFILGGQNNTLSFVFGISNSGYSASLRSAGFGVNVSTQSTKALNPRHDSMQLSAKTNQSADKVGATTELILNCQPR